MSVPSFIIVRYVWQILGKGRGGLSLPSVSSRKKAILNRIITTAFLDNHWKSFCSSSIIPFSLKRCST